MNNEDALDENTSLIPVRFHFFNIKFVPYAHAAGETSKSIIQKVATFLSQEQQKGKGILIDKHQDKGNDIARPLFVTAAVMMFKEKRIRFSMALLRTGKIPMVKPADKFLLVPLDTSVGQIAEQTHFFIDYSTNEVVLCIEFNSNGPRLSDIEYYFRVVARDKLRVAKSITVEQYMEVSVDKALADFRNVLNLEVKVQPQKLASLDTAIVGQYFTGISNLGQFVNPQYVKLEVMFQTPGKKYQSSQVNRQANSMVSQILDAFKAKPTNMDAFENFVVKYENVDGKEDVFNLLKGKKEVIIYIDGSSNNTRKWYEAIEADLDSFIQTL